jgi:hypothetical protein
MIGDRFADSTSDGCSSSARDDWHQPHVALYSAVMANMLRSCTAAAVTQHTVSK